MAAKGVTVAATDFPIYTICILGETHFIVAGGGGQAKTGIPNAVEIYELKSSGKSCTAVKVKQHEIQAGAVMNGCVAPSKQNSKLFMAVFGIENECYAYRFRPTTITPKVDGSVADGLRKRKGNLTDSESHKSAVKAVSFDVECIGSVVTDFGDGGGFQKAVSFSPDQSLIATGGSDGKLRTWTFPDLKSLYEVSAHTDEIDDIHFNPTGNRIVTISRDSKAYIWNTADGTKHSELHWNHRTDAKYRFRSCRFASVVDKKVCMLYTINIPVTRQHKPLPCYITKWDTTKYSIKKCQKTGTDVLSSFAVSDNGMYLGVGTIAGSVSVHIAFSLQRLYHLPVAHSIFVTGLGFTSSTSVSQTVTGNHDVTLLSISADNQVKMHQVCARQEIHMIWPIVGFLMAIYMIYWLLVTLGL